MDYSGFVGDILWAVLLAGAFIIVLCIIGLIGAAIGECLDRLECRVKTQQMNIKKPKNVMKKPEVFK